VVTVTKKMNYKADNALVSKFSNYGATIVAYALSVVLLLKLTGTFRCLHFNLLKRSLHFHY